MAYHWLIMPARRVFPPSRIRNKAGCLHAICTGTSLVVLRLHRTFDSGLCGFIHTESFGFAVGALALGRLHS